jgi:hypothetical protein
MAHHQLAGPVGRYLAQVGQRRVEACRGGEHSRSLVPKYRMTIAGSIPAPAAIDLIVARS